MVQKHKETLDKHKDMMWVHVFLALIVWVFLHMLFPPMHTSSATQDHENSTAMVEHYSPSIQSHQESLAHNLHDELRIIPASIAAPNVSVKITPDEMEWYMLFLWTEHFAFTPKEVGKAWDNDYYEWHATLYINDEYMWRIYSPYHHIPQHFLKSWNNIVLVTLNDNNHKTFSRHDQVIYDSDIITVE